MFAVKSVAGSLKTGSMFQDLYRSDYRHLKYVDSSIRSVTMTALGAGIDLYIYNTGELAYDRLNGTRKIGLSYAKSVIYISPLTTGLGIRRCLEDRLGSLEFSCGSLKFLQGAQICTGFYTQHL